MTVEDLLTRMHQQRIAAPPMGRAIREHARLTQEEVGAAVGVSGSEVSRWEAGRRRPRGSNLAAYAEVLARLREAG
jgi:transcriptional regulator with XRE-family HTH domain